MNLFNKSLTISVIFRFFFITHSPFSGSQTALSIQSSIQFFSIIVLTLYLNITKKSCCIRYLCKPQNQSLRGLVSGYKI